MEKEFKRLIIEIVLLTFFLILIIPICVSASNDYKEKRNVMLDGIGTSVDITCNGDKKLIKVYSRYDVVVKVNLVFKITRTINKYEIMFDDNVYVLDDLEQVMDDEYIYYNLGIYEIDKVREFDFKLMPIGDNRKSETITYGFLTKGMFNGL